MKSACFAVDGSGHELQNYSENCEKSGTSQLSFVNDLPPFFDQFSSSFLPLFFNVNAPNVRGYFRFGGGLEPLLGSADKARLVSASSTNCTILDYFGMSEQAVMPVTSLKGHGFAFVFSVLS